MLQLLRTRTLEIGEIGCKFSVQEEIWLVDQGTQSATEGSDVFGGKKLYY